MPRFAPTAAIHDFVVARLDEGLDVWLMGSRVNPVSGVAPNDWDFLIFGSRALLAELAATPEVEGLDALIVYDDENFESPWPRRSDGAVKSGDLTRWEWSEHSADAATYVGTKAGPDETCEIRTRSAVRITRESLS